jgi:hypothetical protein
MFLVFDVKKIAWWEYALLFGVSIIVIFISKLIIETSMTSDTEYWSELAIEVEYEGAYDEYIHKTCEDCETITNDDGSTSEECEEYDCSYVEDYGPRYRIKGTSQTISISKSEYNRIKNKWGNEKKTGSHPESYSYDDGIYSSFWLNRRELAECIVTSHRYENRVQAAHTVFDFQDVSEEDKKNYGLYDYPEIYEGYKQKNILGFGDETQVQAEKKMQLLNAELGPKKQVKAFILIFRNKSKQSGIMQEAYWEGGNKNEFVLTLGVDNQNNIQWVHSFTWAEHSIVKVEINDYVMQQGQLNLSNISDFMYDELNNNFVRKQFSEFNYLTVEPSGSSIVWSMIVLIIITIGLVFWFVSNEFDDELMSKSNGFRLNKRKIKNIWPFH